MTLAEFFKENSRCALAFSGGADSAYLLCAALRCGADVRAYFAKTPFQPEFELRDAERLARELGARLRIVECDPLSDARVRENGPERCYYCKNAIFSAITAAANEDGYSTVIDGTNASDDAGDRPGMRALREKGVRSPLRECGITKPELRRLSAEAGLFTAKKPAYACLATRIPTGEAIEPSALRRIEKAEAELFAMGFSDFRLRKRGEAALLQLTEPQLALALSRRAEILARLEPHFKEVYLDLAGRRPSL